MTGAAAAEPRFELYVDPGGHHRWRFVGPGNEVVAVGQAYAGKAEALRAVTVLRRQVDKAYLLDLTGEPLARLDPLTNMIDAPLPDPDRAINWPGS